MFSSLFDIFKDTTTPFGWLKLAFKALPLLILTGVLVFAVMKIVSCSTQKLENKVASQNVAITELGTANKDLAKEVITTGKSGSVTLAISLDQDKKEKIIESKFSKREAATTQKVKDFNKTFEEQPKTIDTIKIQIDGNSNIQINSLWNDFCDSSPTSTQCKG